MDALAALLSLTGFESRRRAVAPLSATDEQPLSVPWLEVADLAIAHGLGPLASFALERGRISSAVPEPIRDRLLICFQTTLSDNIHKLLQMKKLLSRAEQVPMVLVGAAAYADALYPHVALRPLPQLHLLVRRRDLERLSQAGASMGLSLATEKGSMAVLSDGRTRLVLEDALFGASHPAAHGQLYERGIPAPVYGLRVRRPAIEDALLAHVALAARRGLAATPLIELVDLREMVRGPVPTGIWEQSADAAVVKARSEALGLSRALWCSMRVLAHFFDELRIQSACLSPELPAMLRAILTVSVVAPSQKLAPARVGRAADEVRKHLL